jgi:hypothetical protein
MERLPPVDNSHWNSCTFSQEAEQAQEDVAPPHDQIVYSLPQQPQLIAPKMVPEGCLTISGNRLAGVLHTPHNICLSVEGDWKIWPKSISQLRSILLSVLEKEGVPRSKVRTVAQGSYLTWLLGALKFRRHDFDIAIKAPPDSPNQYGIMNAVSTAFIDAIQDSFPDWQFNCLEECGITIQFMHYPPALSLATFKFSTEAGQPDIDLSLHFIVDQDVDFTVGSLRAIIDPFFESESPEAAIVYSCLNMSAQQALQNISNRELKTPFPQLTYGLFWRYMHRIVRKGHCRNVDLEAQIGSRMLRDLNRPFAHRIKAITDAIFSKSSPSCTYWMAHKLIELVAKSPDWQLSLRQFITGHLQEIRQRIERDDPDAAHATESYPEGWDWVEEHMMLRRATEANWNPIVESIDPSDLFSQLEKLKEANPPSSHVICFRNLILFIQDNPSLTGYQKATLLIAITNSFLGVKEVPYRRIEPQNRLHVAIAFIKAELALVEAAGTYCVPTDHHFHQTSLHPLEYPVDQPNEALSNQLRRPIWLGDLKWGYLISPFTTSPYVEYLRLVERMTYHDLDRSLSNILPFLMECADNPEEFKQRPLAELIRGMVDDLVFMKSPTSQLVAFYKAVTTFAEQTALETPIWFSITATLIEREITTGEVVVLDPPSYLNQSHFNSVLHAQIKDLPNSGPEAIRKLLILLSWLERCPSQRRRLQHHLESLTTPAQLRTLKRLMEGAGVGRSFPLVLLQIQCAQKEKGDLPPSSHRLTTPTQLKNGLFLPSLFRTGLSERASLFVHLSRRENVKNSRIAHLKQDDLIGSLLSLEIYPSEELAISEWNRLISASARYSWDEAEKIVDLLETRCTPQQLIRLYGSIDEVVGPKLNLDIRCLDLALRQGLPLDLSPLDQYEMATRIELVETRLERAESIAHQIQLLIFWVSRLPDSFVEKKINDLLTHKDRVIEFVRQTAQAPNQLLLLLQIGNRPFTWETDGTMIPFGECGSIPNPFAGEVVDAALSLLTRWDQRAGWLQMALEEALGGQPTRAQVATAILKALEIAEAGVMYAALVQQLPEISLELQWVPKPQTDLPSTKLLKALANFTGGHKELLHLIKSHGGVSKLIGMRLPTLEELPERLRWSLAQPEAGWQMVAWKLCLLYPNEMIAKTTALRLLLNLFYQKPQEHKLMLGVSWRLLYRNHLPEASFREIPRTTLPLIQALCDANQPEWIVIADELSGQLAKNIPEEEALDLDLTRLIMVQRHPNIRRSAAILRDLDLSVLGRVSPNKLLAAIVRPLESPSSERERSWLENEAEAIVRSGLLREESGTAIVRLIELVAQHDPTRGEQLLEAAKKLSWFKGEKGLFKEAAHALMAVHYWHRTSDAETLKKLLSAAIKEDLFNEEDRPLFFAMIWLLKSQGSHLAAYQFLNLQGPFVELDQDEEALLFQISEGLAEGGWCDEAEALLKRSDIIAHPTTRSVQLMVGLYSLKHQLDRRILAIHEIRTTASFPNTPSRDQLSALSFKIEKLLPGIKTGWNQHRAESLAALDLKEEWAGLITQIAFDGWRQGDELLEAADQEEWSRFQKPSLLLFDGLVRLLSLLPQRGQKITHRAIQLTQRVAAARKKGPFDSSQTKLRHRLALKLGEHLANSRCPRAVEMIQEELFPLVDGDRWATEELCRFEIDGLARIGRIDGLEKIKTPSLPLIRAYIRSSRWERAREGIERMAKIDPLLAQAGWLYYAKHSTDLNEIERGVKQATALISAASLTPIQERRWSLVQKHRISFLLQSNNPKQIIQATTLLTSTHPGCGMGQLRKEKTDFEKLTDDALRRHQELALTESKAGAHPYCTDLLGQRLYQIQDRGGTVDEIGDLIERHFTISAEPKCLLKQFVHLIEEWSLQKLLPEAASSIAILIITRLARATGSDEEASLARDFLIWTEKQKLFDCDPIARANGWSIICSRLTYVDRKVKEESRFIEAHDLLSYAHYRLGIFNSENEKILFFSRRCKDG